MRRTWGRRGHTPLIVVSKKRRSRVNASGWLCVNPATGQVRFVYTAQRTAITRHELPALIDRLRGRLGGPVVLVWDNHSSHTAGRVRAHIQAQEWLSVVHLPAYAPELNPVETVWSHLKSFLANRAFRSVDELEKVMRSHLASIQKRPDLLRGFIRSVGLDPQPLPSTTQ